MDKLLSSRELGEYLNLRQVTVRRKAARGEIPATRIGHHFRFDKSEIDVWLQQNRPGKQLQILVVDDDPEIGQLISDIMTKSSCQVTVALSSPEALNLIGDKHFDMLFLDLILPGMDGIEAFKRIREENQNIPVAIITGYPDSDLMDQALKYGPLTVIKKPFSHSNILAVVDSFLHVNQ